MVLGLRRVVQGLAVAGFTGFGGVEHRTLASFGGTFEVAAAARSVLVSVE